MEKKDVDQAIDGVSVVKVIKKIVRVVANSIKEIEHLVVLKIIRNFIEKVLRVMNRVVPVCIGVNSVKDKHFVRNRKLGEVVNIRMIARGLNL